MAPKSIGDKLASAFSSPSRREEEGMTLRQYYIGQLLANPKVVKGVVPDDDAALVVAETDCLIAAMDLENEEASSQVSEPNFAYRILRKIPFVSNLLS